MSHAASSLLLFPTTGLQTAGLHPHQVMLSHATLRPPPPLRPPPRLILLPCLLLCSLLLLASPPPAHAGWWSSGSKDVPALPTVAHDQVAPVRLDWEGITCELKLKTKEGSKNLLSQVTGHAEPGRLLAILGPSGSGKTTLLNVLAGQVPASSALTLHGRLYVNGQLVSHSSLPSSSSSSSSSSEHTQAYVRQQDIFYSQLTVRETLLMAARLRLPSSLNLEQKTALVDSLLKRLGLAKAADTVVGDDKIRGISGGEKKRLSLACELLGSPSLIFADEPTSGLDSYQSFRVLENLKDLASNGGHTVIISIHQPRSSIFTMFDDVVLMTEGEVVYSGEAAAMVPYFAALGFPCPKNFNPAEHVLDLVSIDYTTVESEVASRTRVHALLSAHRASLPSLLKSIQSHRKKEVTTAKNGAREGKVLVVYPRPPGKLEQFRLLFTRSWRQITRSTGANIARAASNVFSALVFGALFYQMGRGQSSIQDRMGLLQVAAINAAMSSLIKTITVFIKERLIVSRERSSGKGSTYGPGPYFISKLAAELPVTALFPCLFGGIMYPLAGLQMTPQKFLKFLGILIVESYAAAGFGMFVGTLVPSVDAGLAVAPAVMVLFIVLGGYYVNEKSVPLALRWIQDVSLIKYAFEALCINEFQGLEFTSEKRIGPGPPVTHNGEQVLQRLNFHESTVTRAVVRQGALAGVSYLLTYLMLAWKKPRFQRVLSPEEVVEAKEKKERKEKKRRWGRKKALGGSGQGTGLPAVDVPSTVRAVGL